MTGGRTPGAAIAVALAMAAPAAAAVDPAPALTPRADRFGEVTLAGTTVLWDGDAELEDQGLVVAAARTANGTYAQGRVISTPGRDAFVAGAGADAAGAAVVGLNEFAKGSEGTIPRVVEIAADGTLRGRDLERPRSGVVVRGMDVAVNPRGDAIVVWDRWAQRADTFRVMAVVRPAGGTWGPPVALSRAYPAREERLGPRVGVDDQGRFTAAWQRDGVIAVTGSVGGGAATPRRIGPGGEVSGVAVAAAGDRALVAWAQPGRRADTALAALRSGDGAIGPPRRLAPARAGRFIPRVTAAAGPDGTAVAGFAVERGRLALRTTAIAYRAAVARPGARFAAWRPLTAFNRKPAGPSPFAAAVGPDGTASVVWRQSGRVEVAFAATGTRFGRPVVLGRSGANDTGDITGIAGGAIVAWTGNGRVRISTATAP